MAPIRLDENWLAEHPQVAEKIRQVEAAKKDASGGSESDEKVRPHVPIPPKPKKSSRLVFVPLVVIAAAMILFIGEAVYGMGHLQTQSSKQAMLKAQEEAIQNNYLNGSPVAQQTNQSSQQTQGTPQAAPSQQPAVSQPAPAGQQSEAAVTITPVQPARTQTLGQWLIANGKGPSGSETSPGYYTATLPMPDGTTKTINGSWTYIWQQIDTLEAMPVSALLNQNQPPITGQMVGNDLPVTLEVSGPNGIKTIQGKIDSGTVRTAFPDSFLRSLGYTPVSTQTVLGVTGQQTEGVYDIPFIQIRGNNGQWETLYPGTLPVWGDQFDEALIGADVLQHCSLSVNGSTFVLGLPN